MLGDLAAQKDLLFFFAESQRAEVAHAPLADHGAGHLGGALNVVGGAGGHLAEEDLLRQPSAHHDGDHGLQILLVVVVLVSLRQLHGDAQRHATGDYGDLMQRIGVRQFRRDQRVSRFVISRDFLFFFGEQQRLALGAHQDFIFGQLKVVHQHRFAIVARRQQRRFVHHVGQVSAGE